VFVVGRLATNKKLNLQEGKNYEYPEYLRKAKSDFPS